MWQIPADYSIHYLFLSVIRVSQTSPNTLGAFLPVSLAGVSHLCFHMGKQWDCNKVLVYMTGLQSVLGENKSGGGDPKGGTAVKW